MTGIGLIAVERNEQILKHKFTSDHDDNYDHIHGELKDAALYVLTEDETKYPLCWDLSWKYKFQGKTYKEKLIIAGALLAAELDRLERLENK